MAKQIDPRDVKWFGPLWRRIALAAVLALWSVGEWVGGDTFWGMTTTAVFAYVIWKLFIDFPSAEEIAAFEAEQAAKAEEIKAASEPAAPSSDDDGAN